MNDEAGTMSRSIDFGSPAHYADGPTGVAGLAGRSLPEGWIIRLMKLRQFSEQLVQKVAACPGAADQHECTGD